MDCASCHESTGDGRFTNWVTGRMVEDTNLESPTSSVLVRTRTYYDFAPLDVFVCNPCYAVEEGRQKTRFWLFVALGVLGAAAALYALIGPSDSTLRIVLGVLALPMIPIGIGGAAHFSYVYRLAGNDLQSHLTEGFVRRLVRASGRDAFWTEADFEANQQALLRS